MDAFLLPQYTTAVPTEPPTGTTIANIPATIARWFGLAYDGLPPLPNTHSPTAVDKKPPQRIVLLILDALGRNLVDRHPQSFAPLLDTAVVDQTITSVFPSTTVNALSCLWTGAAPATHGLVQMARSMFKAPHSIAPPASTVDILSLVEHCHDYTAISPAVVERDRTDEADAKTRIGAFWRLGTRS